MIEGSTSSLPGLENPEYEKPVHEEEEDVPLKDVYDKGLTRTYCVTATVCNHQAVQDNWLAFTEFWTVQVYYCDVNTWLVDTHVDLSDVTVTDSDSNSPPSHCNALVTCEIKHWNNFKIILK